MLDPGLVHSVMAKKLGVPFVNLRAFQPSPEALKRIPPSVAQRYQVLPLAEMDNALVVAIDDPTNMERMEEVRFAAGTKLIPVMAPGVEIRQALEAAYGAEHGPQAARTEPDLRRRAAHAAAVDRSGRRRGDRAAGRAQTDSTLVKLVNKIIVDAVEQKASDIHIESNPGGRNLRVRFRKDGVLVNYLEIPARFRNAVISRLKIMASSTSPSGASRRTARSTSGASAPLDVELRVATIPTANGLEDVVMRVLAAASRGRSSELGFDADTLAHHQAADLAAARPVPRLRADRLGQDHDAALAARLHQHRRHARSGPRRTRSRSRRPGLRQVQVNPKIGWTFAAAMRSFLRADPDVIMVGEMRDAGDREDRHRSLAHRPPRALHAAHQQRGRERGAPARPRHGSVQFRRRAARRARAAAGAPAVHALPRRGTSRAEEMEELALEYCADDDEQVHKLMAQMAPGRDQHASRQGLRECDNTGYKGRIAVYELMVADAAVKRLIQTRAPVADIAAAALAETACAR